MHRPQTWRALSPFLVAAFLLLLLGCKTPEETLVGKPPDKEKAATRGEIQITGDPNSSSDVPGQPQQKRPAVPPPAITMEGWPYEEPGNNFRLSWSGGKSRVPLFAQPDPNSAIVGDVTWKNGEEVRWTGTVVSVYQPSVYVAKHAVTIQGTIYTTGYLTGDPYITHELRKGQRLGLFLYAGSNECYLGVDKGLFSAPCPREEDFRGNFRGANAAQKYQPQKLVWWIQIPAGLNSAWFPLDDRFVVDIID